MKAFVVPNMQKGNTDAVIEDLKISANHHSLELCFAEGFDGSEVYKPEKSQLDLLEKCDVVIAIGGDGTIIHCARICAIYNKPIMGINAGKLGFLAQVERSSLESCITRLTNGDYTVEYRTTLAADFSPQSCRPLDFAVNDVVLTKTEDYNVAEFEISCNGKPIDHYNADGLVFSTATGSTAYNLSAGGPVIDPLLGVITLAPICPHTFAVRPLVFSEKRIITVRSPHTPIIVIADGSRRRQIKAGVEVHISVAGLRAGFITFCDKEFFEILTAKIKQRG